MRWKFCHFLQKYIDTEVTYKAPVRADGDKILTQVGGSVLGRVDRERAAGGGVKRKEAGPLRGSLTARHRGCFDPQ